MNKRNKHITSAWMFRPFLIPSAHDQTRTRHAVALWTTVTSGSVSSLAFLGAGEVTIAFQGGRGGVCLFYKNKKQRIDYCISEKQGGGSICLFYKNKR